VITIDVMTKTISAAESCAYSTCRVNSGSTKK